MSNMSYCRFENTYRALVDCFNGINETDLSESEKRFRKLLVDTCKDITDEYDDEIANHMEESGDDAETA